MQSLRAYTRNGVKRNHAKPNLVFSTHKHLHGYPRAHTHTGGSSLVLNRGGSRDGLLPALGVVLVVDDLLDGLGHAVGNLLVLEEEGELLERLVGRLGEEEEDEDDLEAEPAAVGDEVSP